MWRVSASLDFHEPHIRGKLRDSLDLPQGSIFIIAALNGQYRTEDLRYAGLYVPAAEFGAEPDVIPAPESTIHVFMVARQTLPQHGVLISEPGCPDPGDGEVFHKQMRRHGDDPGHRPVAFARVNQRDRGSVAVTEQNGLVYIQLIQQRRQYLQRLIVHVSYVARPGQPVRAPIPQSGIHENGSASGTRDELGEVPPHGRGAKPFVEQNDRFGGAMFTPNPLVFQPCACCADVRQSSRPRSGRLKPQEARYLQSVYGTFANPAGFIPRWGMNDESLTTPETVPEALRYPLSSRPEVGQAIQVAPGVHWIRMPLPMALNHINLWALEDGEGWTLVDTGMQTSPIATAWEQLLAGPLAGKPVRRVLCTHMHPDHVGMAGWLTRRFDCPFWITRLEYVTCRMLVADTGREAPSDAVRFYKASGWKSADVEIYKARFGGFGKMVYALPDSYRRVSDGDQLLIGGRRWHAVIGRGHSPEHLCLHCPELRLFISGDQVLPRITSNVSVFPTEPEADPLKDWLDSLASIRARVPDDVLVLPAHNDPFEGLHRRVEQLIQGHERSLERLRAMLLEPKTACDVFSVLFRRPVTGDMLQMATGESLAHLNCLIQRGQARRATDSAGVAWYQAT